MIFSGLIFSEDKPKYLQIENHIKHMIDSGMLAGNGKLPATRELAKMLGVSRNVVLSAYENLEIQGITYSIKGKGTFVAKKEKFSNEKWIFSWNERKNNYSKMAEALDITKHELPWEKDFISFRSISPDGKLFNLDEFKKACLNSLAIEGDHLLNYGYARGYKPLIHFLQEYMRQKGIETKNKEILITNGFTEGLDMLLTAYTHPKDKIICENPTHNTAIKIMKAHGLETVGITMKEDGIDIQELENKLKNDDIKWSYLIPSYHNPTGIVISDKKRKSLYQIFKKYNVPIIEDGFNEELLYNAQHISPLAALDNNGAGVVYISSFSKILFPGIRVGWIAADRVVIDTLESVKRCKNIHTSILDQAVLYEYLRSGAFEKNIKNMRRVYKERYLFAVDCVQKYIRPSFIWGQGGLFIYIGLGKMESRELLSRCYERKVIFTPGDIFSTDMQSCKNTLRLSLSKLSMEQIEKGIRIIGECVGQFR